MVKFLDNKNTFSKASALAVGLPKKNLDFLSVTLLPKEDELCDFDSSNESCESSSEIDTIESHDTTAELIDSVDSVDSIDTFYDCSIADLIQLEYYLDENDCFYVIDVVDEKYAVIMKNVVQELNNRFYFHDYYELQNHELKKKLMEEVIKFDKRNLKYAFRSHYYKDFTRWLGSWFY